MAVYFVMMPCWFKPGSSSRKLTAEEGTAVSQFHLTVKLQEQSSKMHFHQEQKVEIFVEKERSSLRNKLDLSL